MLLQMKSYRLRLHCGFKFHLGRERWGRIRAIHLVAAALGRNVPPWFVTESATQQLHAVTLLSVLPLRLNLKTILTPSVGSPTWTEET